MTRLSRRRMIWLLPNLRSRKQAVCLSQCFCASPVEILTVEERGGGGGGADGEEAWSSINHSIISDFFLFDFDPNILKHSGI